MKIFVTRKIPKIGIEKLKKAGYDVKVREEEAPIPRDEFLNELKNGKYDAVLSLLSDKIDAEVFDASPKTKIFSNYAIGYNNMDVKEAEKRGVYVTNTPSLKSALAVAERTVCLMIAVASRIIEADQYVRKGGYKYWDPNLFIGQSLYGKKFGIIGAGRIGSRAARIAHNGFAMPVVYYDIERNEEIEYELGADRRDSMEQILKESDVVSLHVPLNEKTKGIINKKHLEMMKPTAVLINTSRGPVIKENDLVDALKDRKIAGAGLDVFENEPDLALGLSELPNVVLPPHIASATEDGRNEMSEMAADNIIAVLSGEKPPYPAK